MPITEHTIKTERHTTFYLAAGPENGPLVIFVHGWPELSISWRHQLPTLAALGFRTIAPDMRGYGRSSVYSQYTDYAQEHIVRDMLELLDAVGREKAPGRVEPRQSSSRPLSCRRQFVCALLHA